MNVRGFLGFAGKVALAHAVTYFVAGALAYSLLTREFYEGPSPVMAASMRTADDPILWSHVTTWFLPAQLLRGFLIAAALYPFVGTLTSWGYWRRALSVAGLYLVLGFWGATVAAPCTIEGLVYLRPEYTAYVHLRVQPEIVLQGLALGAWVAGWLARRPTRSPDTGTTARERHPRTSSS